MEKHFCLDDSPMFRMIELDEVDSTNNFLHSSGCSGASRNLRHLETPGDHRITLVTAEYQSAGRGADTNRWESAKGENLLFSLRVMFSDLPVRRMFAISEAVAMAVRESLGEAFTVKWPNDIYYGDSKVAGILIENDLQGSKVRNSVIGVGINVNQRCFLSDAPNPRSLADIVGHDVERRFVLELFMESITRYIRQLDSGKEEQLDALHEKYKEHLYRRGEEHTYSDKGGTFRATIIDVEPTGHLVLQDPNGNTRRYEFKEVKYEI